jgi:hypothetical protein
MSPMRLVLVLVVLALAGCGKKKAPQSPATNARELKEDVDMKETNAPDNADDPPPTSSSDPQEGGE